MKSKKKKITEYKTNTYVYARINECIFKLFSIKNVHISRVNRHVVCFFLLYTRIGFSRMDNFNIKSTQSNQQKKSRRTYTP